MILKQDFYRLIDQVVKIKKEKYQRWPIHVVSQASKIFRKAGDLMAAADTYKYYRSNEPLEAMAQHAEMEKLCLETIATCLRFLERQRPYDGPKLDLSFGRLVAGDGISINDSYDTIIITKDDGVNEPLLIATNAPELFPDQEFEEKPFELKTNKDGSFSMEKIEKIEMNPGFANPEDLKELYEPDSHFVDDPFKNENPETKRISDLLDEFSTRPRPGDLY